jgi:hypothetical protein
MKYLLLIIFASNLLLAQTDLNQTVETNELNVIDAFKSDFKFQFSLGGGVRFYNHFNQSKPIINTDFSFRFSKNFMLINGAEFSIHKYISYDIEDFGEEKTNVYTSLFTAPSLFIQIGHLLFYAGGGIGMTLPVGPYGFHILSLTSLGYKISKITSLNLFIKVPMYLNGKIEGLSAFLTCTFQF